MAEDEAFWPEAMLHREILRAGAMGKVLAVFNEGKEHYYHALARLSVLMEAPEVPGSYRSRRGRIPKRRSGIGVSSGGWKTESAASSAGPSATAAAAASSSDSTR